MSHKTFFRLIVALSLLVAIGGGVASAFPGDISSDWKAVLEWQGDGEMLMRLYENIPEKAFTKVLLNVFSVALILFAIATQIGMFLFWRFARPTYAALTLLFVIYAIFGGLLILTPVEVVFYNLVLLLDGAIIAMSYLSPIKGYFEKSGEELQHAG